MKENLISAVVRVGERETPVWSQSRWEHDEYAKFIRNNGCGHCCAAMAANLQGIEIDPYEEYVRCLCLWGEPTGDQGNWLSTAGIEKVLRSLGVPAQGFGVKHQGRKKATEHILSALQEGKQVIFGSDPDHYPENPFSRGYHWVMAVCLQEDGTVLIANSSEKAAPAGIQSVRPDVIEKALFKEATSPKDMTWGEQNRIHEGSGYIVVG